jgi:hypothetical protein
MATPGEAYSFRTMAWGSGNPYVVNDFKHRTSMCARPVRTSE